MNKSKLYIFAVILLSTFTQSFLVNGYEDYSIESAIMNVYRDGLIHINYVISVNDTAPSIDFPLISPTIYNLEIYDIDRIPVDYEFVPSNLLIFTLGSNSINVEYDSWDLTEKQGTLWTLTLDTSFPIRVILPKQSIIVYLSDIPEEILSIGDETILELQANQWEISYNLPIINQTTTTTTQTVTTSDSTVTSDSTNTSSNGNNNQNQFSSLYPYIGGVVIAGIVIFSLLLYQQRIRKRRLEETGIVELRKDDRKVLRFIHESGGKVLESDIRKKFLLPKTSLWRMIRRLERMSLVKVVRIGVQNEVELIKGNSNYYLKGEDE